MRSNGKQSAQWVTDWVTELFQSVVHFTLLHFSQFVRQSVTVLWDVITVQSSNSSSVLHCSAFHWFLNCHCSSSVAAEAFPFFYSSIHLMNEQQQQTKTEIALFFLVWLGERREGCSEALNTNKFKAAVLVAVAAVNLCRTRTKSVPFSFSFTAFSPFRCWVAVATSAAVLCLPRYRHQHQQKPPICICFFLLFLVLVLVSSRFAARHHHQQHCLLMHGQMRGRENGKRAQPFLPLSKKRQMICETETAGKNWSHLGRKILTG